MKDVPTTVSVPQQPRHGQRDPYVAVCLAWRQAMVRARSCAHELAPSDWRVLLAVNELLTTYSKLTDACGRDDIAALAGVSEATAKRSLKRLDQLGVITWRPNPNRGLSTVSIDVGSSR